MVTSGIRIGSAALTTRGMGVARRGRSPSWWPMRWSRAATSSASLRVAREVRELCDAFPVYRCGAAPRPSEAV